MQLSKTSKQNSLTWFQRLAIKGIRGYQLFRPFFRQINLSIFGVHSECPQTPSCSEFTLHAIREHGTIAGLSMGMRRILACR
ncbi:hypothetical protein C5B42_02735 [Candidatus Cerribacteria bacterium 'Amazon FNV 2010 28 9']|uniref:Membrane protein insertion efficiency factor YidD n=1 Tax=Candidatus Cerribacteria bacterium 'Amazon FNV 2010 28 9' TaxID=2081795 RepID=A0A317JSU0_9BACT|nr:MAG: hypothetical protein C5B42_02735 [Candidatus Cerribacteria bacterium 'Amazon FNV 2010 28 9']